MKKIILRIVVTLLILALVGVGLWFIFYKPSDNVSVFNSLTKLEANEKVEFDHKLNGYVANVNNGKVLIKGIKHYNKVYPVDQADENNKEYNLSFEMTDENNTAEIQKYKNVVAYRAFMFSNTGIVNTSGKWSNSKSTFLSTNNPYVTVANYLKTINAQNLDFVNFENVYLAIDKAYKFYYSYSQLATGVDGKTINNLNSSIGSFKRAIYSFNDKADEIIKLSTQIPTKFDTTVVNEIYKGYSELYKNMFNILKTYNNLTITLKNYVNKFVFDSNPVFDATSVLYEIITRTVNEFTNNTIVDPIAYFNNDPNLTDEQKEQYENFLSYAYDAMLVNKIAVSDVTDEMIQNYAELLSYDGENASTANAIIGSQNIFTLSRKVKAQLIKENPDVDDVRVSDLYYTDEGFGDKIIQLITSIYKDFPKAI